MRFLADENCGFAIVRALRAAGHEVMALAEISPRAEDPEVIRLGLRAGQILLTEDKHFGLHVFAHGHQVSGVIFLRFPTSTRHEVARAVVQLVREQGDRLRGCFVVVQPGKIRIRRPPS